MTWQMIEGDATAMLATLAADSVHCCVTSPPYFGLRDYHVAGQIGLERTIEEYVERLVEVCFWCRLATGDLRWLVIHHPVYGHLECAEAWLAQIVEREG